MPPHPLPHSRPGASRWLRLLLWALPVALVVALAPVEAAAGARPERGPVTAEASASARVPFTEAVRRLPVAAEAASGYDRDLFPHWIGQGAGCDTRDRVLIAEATRAPSVSPSCTLTDGRWRSRYDGVATTDPSTFDVDHVVALAEAWRSGARRWSTAKRTRFANDLGDPRTLIAVSASSNRAKGDDDPTDWLPAERRCRYLKDWTAVKLRWGLSADRAEARLLRREAARCGGGLRVRPR